MKSALLILKTKMRVRLRPFLLRLKKCLDRCYDSISHPLNPCRASQTSQLRLSCSSILYSIRNTIPNVSLVFFRRSTFVSEQARILDHLRDHQFWRGLWAEVRNLLEGSELQSVDQKCHQRLGRSTSEKDIV
jgi:hypothetical protein